MERKHYIDNLRWFVILLLFPFHTAEIWSSFSSFYIWESPSHVLSGFIMFVNPWFMPLLFVISGMSAKYVLDRYGVVVYIKKRLVKLLLPFSIALVTILPFMTYMAEVFHHDYMGGYFKQYVLFFTKETDLTGFNGGFTPGHLWFIVYLLIISLIGLPIIQLVELYFSHITRLKWSMTRITLLALPLLASYYVINISFKSVGHSLLLFLIGYFVLTRDELVELLQSYRWRLLSVSLFLDCVLVYLLISNNYQPNFIIELLYVLVGWFGVLAAIALGKTYFDYSNKVTKFIKSKAYVLYFMHLPYIVLVAYYVVQLEIRLFIKYLLILLISFGLSILSAVGYNIVKKQVIKRGHYNE